MGVERLQHLFRICNLLGLLPFRMVLDAQTKGFKRFESHWRHPNNWWFIILLIGQICFLTIISLSFWSLIAQKLESLSLVMLMIFTLLSSSYFIWLVSVRLFLFRFRHLETALEIFHGIDRLLNKIHHATCNNTQRRTIIGTFLCLIWVV